MLKEEPARKGFLARNQYTKLAEECGKIGPWLAAMFEIAVTYGWRKCELKMKVEQIDLNERTIRLYKKKNGAGRVVVMTQRVYDLISQ